VAHGHGFVRVGSNYEEKKMRQFEVVGDEYEDVEGDVMGDVMGYSGPMHRASGDDEYVVVGRTAQGHQIVRATRAGGNVSVRKPEWRRTQMAPGVIAPDQGLLPLPLTGRGGTNIFTATLNSIIFEGQIQKPFRGERLLTTVTRTGTSATGSLLGQLFVGTDLQQLDIFPFNIEQVGQVNGFGIRLTMKPAQPGVFLRISVSLSTPLTTTDTIAADITILGRNVH
jgi:hypothetical protein